MVAVAAKLTYTAAMQIENPPTLTLSKADAGAAQSVSATGKWQVNALAQCGAAASLIATLNGLKDEAGVSWDLSRIDSIDHVGAQMFWNAWGKQRPAQLQLAPAHQELFRRIEEAGTLELPRVRAPHRLSAVITLGFDMMAFYQHLLGFVRLVGGVSQDVGRFARRPLRGPWREISANIFHAGFQALGITALVGFLIGVVLSYLSAQQLRTFGGDIYLVNILGMSVIRELGPLLAAILVAGRSGSALAARLSTMQINQEIDALRVMGINPIRFLVLPALIAMMIMMPALTFVSDVVGLGAGGLYVTADLGISQGAYWHQVIDYGSNHDLWHGIGKSVIFAVLITLIGVANGASVTGGAEGVGRVTTRAVVQSISAIVITDMLFVFIVTHA